MAPRRNARQGVVLLLILSLLVLFSLLALTFLIGATRYRQGAESFGQQDLRGDNPARLADLALFQLLREPANPYSSLWGHSLLLDLYGRDGTGGWIAHAEIASTSGGDVAMGEIIRLDVLYQDPPVANRGFDTVTFGDPSIHEDYYAGSVISIRASSGSAESARVVRYVPPTASGTLARFYVEGFETNSAAVRTIINANAANNPVAFLVNGKPFNGSGFGYSLENGGRFDLDTDYGDPNRRPYIFPGDANNPQEAYGVPIALQPHYASYLLPRRAPSAWALPRGDGDESYDALDYHNMFLARNPPSASGLGIVASFHRPSLIRTASNSSFWSAATNNNYRSFRRRFVFRPMPWDHPDFTGSNPTLATQPFNPWLPGNDTAWGIAGVDDDGQNGADDPGEAGWPGSDDVLVNDAQLVQALINVGTGGGAVYDVDNDGDGVPDSFWIDLQFPVKTSKDGRLYKPLFAFLVVDQDGRLNVNAHGNLAQTQPGYHTGDQGAAAARPYAGQNPPGSLSLVEQRDITGDNAIDRPAHGQGYGPAAISLRHLLDAPNNPTDVDDYQALLLARYGADNAPGSASMDFLSYLKAVGRPDEYASFTSANYGSWDNPSAYFSPPDLFDRGTAALNYAGRPIWRYSGRQGTFTDASGNVIRDQAGNMVVHAERTNHPYEFNMVRPSGDDQPFTPAELEAVLRWRDGDAGVLANRLFNLLANSGDGSPTIDELSKLLTTHSAYVPSPPTAPLAPDDGITNLQIFDILFPTSHVLPLNPNNPQPNPLLGNAAQIAVRVVDVATGQVTGMQGVVRMPTIIDLMAAKIVQGHATSAPRAAIPSDPLPLPRILNGGNLVDRQRLQQQLDRMLAIEFRRGQKMDPNRLWGNGQDDTANAIVDEQGFNTGNGQPVWEQDLPENIWGGSGAAGVANYVNDDPIVGAGVSGFHPRGREVFARQLFCLMMLLVDLDYTPSAGGTLGEPQFPGYLEPYVDPSLTTNFQRRELTIRRLAQWAINAVDFRDADAIMTPFEYDLNPWNGYDVDGDLATDDTPPNQFDFSPAHPERRVVWGCESPDLLITETFAMHDRRVKDTNVDDDQQKKRDEPMNADATLDQYRIPQGSLFVELKCPQRNFYSNGTEADLRVAPRELYNVDANGVRLHLARLAPPDPGTGLRYPVWRMAISESYNRGPNAATVDGPLELISAQKRDNVSFQPSKGDEPEHMYLVRPTNPADVPDLPIDRIVWFAPQTPNPPAMQPQFPSFEQNRVYYNRFGATEITAGEYLVVGPRAITHVGSKDEMGDPGSSTIDSPSEQIFRLVNDVSNTPVPFFTYTDFGYPRRFSTIAGVPSDTGIPQVKMARTIVAAADPPTSWGANPVIETANVLAGVPNAPPTPGVGLSISEPLRHQYYREPTDFLEGSATANYPLRDAYRDVVNGTNNLPDVPFDTDTGEANPRPIRDDNLAQTARYGDYKTIFLQRLANPLLPWHPTLNPYLTIDWQAIDITVFNGEDRERSASMGQWDPDDGNPNQDNSTSPRAPNDPPFASRERIGQRAIPANVNYGLWNTASLSFDQAEDDVRNAPPNVDFFCLNARHSLGYLNRQVDNNPGHANKNPANTLTPVDLDDFVTAPAAGVNPPPIGDPLLPFEWLTWNDRPYVSHLEMMFVPASSPGRLTFEFTHRHPADPNGNPYQPYDLATPPVDPAMPPYTSYRASFGHLLNFFNTNVRAAPNATTLGANYYRLLDFVEVPSRFAGAEKWYNPSDVRGAAGSANDVVRYRPPFNWLSRFSDPGRVNLNTAWDPRVWLGVAEGFPLMANNAFWNNTLLGTMTAGAGPGTPTDYPNPIRAAGSALLSPTLPGDPLRQDPVEATLLRSENPTATPRQPLFDNPNFADATTAPANLAVHPRPNAYFRYQGLQRLGNLVSGQSNVYAVWVTVGYFEVEKSPAGQDRERPDGYLLGQEVGVETGEIVRHRAFYLIDRSTPVAFQPGKDHNVEKAILLRRFIE